MSETLASYETVRACHVDRIALFRDTSQRHLFVHAKSRFFVTSALAVALVADRHHITTCTLSDAHALFAAVRLYVFTVPPPLFAHLLAGSSKDPVYEAHHCRGG